MNASDVIQIIEKKPDHHYRVEIPSIVHELDLSGNAFKVYSKIKQIAGDDGVCFMKISTLSEKCGVSENTLRSCIEDLEKNFDIIGSSLIERTARKKVDGKDDTYLITIVDIWRVNGDYWRSISTEKKRQKTDANIPPKTRVQNLNPMGAKFEPKQEHSEEEPLKGQCNTRASENGSKKNTASLPFSKEEIKKPLSEDEMQFCAFLHQEIKNTFPNSDTDSLAYLMKKFGVDKVGKAWQYVKSQKGIGKPVAYMRTALERDWILPDDQTKTICQVFANEFPDHCQMTSKYLKYLDGSGEVYFSMDVMEAIEQLEKKRNKIENK